MPLFNESLESIAQAVVTVKRAVKAGAIEKGDYKELNDYLKTRSKDFGITKKHLARANKDLDDELKAEVEEFFMDEGDALAGWAEDFLQEFKGEKDEGPYNWGLDVKAEPAVEPAVPAVDKRAAAEKAWANMDDEERAAMAALASAWQKR
jgi:hypothetical protein